MLAKEQRPIQLPVAHLRIWLDGSAVLVYCEHRGALISCGAAVLAALAARCDGRHWPLIADELEREMGISQSEAVLATEQARRLFEPRRALFPEGGGDSLGTKPSEKGASELRITAPDRGCQLVIDVAEESARLPLQRLLSPLLSNRGPRKVLSVHWQISRSEQGWTLSGEHLHPVSGLAMQQLGPVLIDHLKHWLLQHSSACFLMQGDAIAWKHQLWLLPSTAESRQRALSAQLMQCGAVHLSQQLIGVKADWSALDLNLPVQVERSDWCRMPPQRWLDQRSWRGLDGRELRYYFVPRSEQAFKAQATLLLRCNDTSRSLCEAGSITEWCTDLKPTPYQPLSSNAASVSPMPLHRLVPWLSECPSLFLPVQKIDSAGQELEQWLGFDRDRRQILNSARDHLALLDR